MVVTGPMRVRSDPTQFEPRNKCHHIQPVELGNILMPVASLWMVVCVLFSSLVPILLQLYSLEHCVLGAYADDGGMFLPAVNPDIRSLLPKWAGLSFQEVMGEVLRLFIEEDEVPTEELKKIIQEAFESFIQYGSDGTTKVNEMSLVELNSPVDGSRPLAIAELWHGPTLAFKDLPLQILGGLLSFFLNQRREKINILVGTSGDTGSSAIEAVRRSPYCNIFVLFPSHGRITQIQELQMTTVVSPLKNVYVGACDGTSDELDVPILNCFEKDEEFKKKYKLCSINSVNIIRILTQTVHFIYSYLRIAPDCDREVDFAIPSGAAGHIAAGVLAKQMGLPIGRLLAATNDNDLLATFLTTGKFYPKSSAIPTSSPAIDIQVPYNVERILYLLSPGTAADKGRAVKGYLASLSSDEKGFQLSSNEFQRWKQFGLNGYSVTHDQVIGTIKQCWEKQAYMLDPHTAVAVHAASTLSAPSSPSLSTSSSPSSSAMSRIVVLSTAHSAKFLPTVTAATGLTESDLRKLFSANPFANVRRVNELYEKKSHSQPFGKGSDWSQQLRDWIVEVNHMQEKGENGINQTE